MVIPYTNISNSRVIALMSRWLVVIMEVMSTIMEVYRGVMSLVILGL